MGNAKQHNNKKVGPTPEARSEASTSSHENGVDATDNDWPSKETLDSMLARQFRRRFTDVLEFNLPPEIEGIKVGKMDLRLSVCIPMGFPDPSPDNDKWWATRAAQKQLRRGFANHLLRPKFKKRLANILSTELLHFLFELDPISRFSEGIQKKLRRIPQEILAGQPKNIITNDIAKEIANEGATIYRTLKKIETAIRRWKKNEPTIDDSTIKTKLLRYYPVKTHPWMGFFYELTPNLPCKPYFQGTGGETDVLDKKPLPAKLCEPDRWWTIAIAAKVLQKVLILEHGTRFPLRGIRKALGKVLPPVSN